MRTAAATVFVVDDDASILRAMTRLFKSEGLSVETFPSPREFLERPPHDGPGCLVLDLQMPELDGLETTRRIVAEYGVDRPRIVAMTANAMESDRADCFAAGMDDYIAKPIRPDELAGALARCTPRDASRKSTGSQDFP